MKNIFQLFIILLIFNSCKTESKQNQKGINEFKAETIINANYELITPKGKPKAVLVLFGGYPEKPSDIKQEFQIVDIAKQNNVALLLMNYNQKLWLEEFEKEELAIVLQNAIIDNSLPANNIYIGGFSSGGNISLLMSDFIISKNQFNINPKGVFAIDSPIDFLAMHGASERIIKRDPKSEFIQESIWLKKTFESQFGNPTDSISKYEQYSVFTSQTGNTKNISHLKDIKIRFYTEPDTLWWKKFNANYEDMNGYNIKRLSEKLKKEFKEQNVEYIATKNKGYRTNGQRNPHSWSIVDKENLIKWMLNKSN